jgi:mRNA interferase MazF
MYTPKRGDFVYVNFDPQAGHEQAGRRPAIVLSPIEFNQSTGFAVVCPITNQVKGYPFEIPVPSESGLTGVVLTDQMRTFDWNARNFQFKGEATLDFVQECLDYVHTYL